jgi:tRNA (guanine-N7-)-methyltransferase
MTDDEIYAERTKDILSAHNSLECINYEQNPYSPQKTKYERKWLEMGRSVWRVRIKKVAAFTTERFIKKSITEDKDSHNGGNKMHIKLENTDYVRISAEKLDFLFDEGGKQGNDVHWVFKRHFNSNSNSERVHLIETVSSDAGFEQKYYLKVIFRDEDDVNTTLVKIDGNSSVFLTPSVRYALNDLANRIKS